MPETRPPNSDAALNAPVGDAAVGDSIPPGGDEPPRVEQPGQERRPPLKSVLSRLKPGAGVPDEIAGIVRVLKKNHPKADVRNVVKAYELARSLHSGQQRKSGEEFISHPINVALIVADQGMDELSIVAALLHDAVEDTELGLSDVVSEFGEETAEIIDGLTKIERIKFRSAEQEQADNLRKMIVAMARDIRVLIVKLADRLHNMRTIDGLDDTKRELMANETLEIYAPLAHRLAMYQFKTELEDLAFKTLHPKRYKEIDKLVSNRLHESEKYLEDALTELTAMLKRVKVKAQVTGRHKHHFSVYEKMMRQGISFDEVWDLIGVRVITDDLRDCWAALGAVHAGWKPVPGRFKDYIANPKFHVYQSLHTTVVGPEGKPLEIQIRTQQMHRVAEYGVAAHWHYKEGFSKHDRDEQSAWMSRMVELQATEDASEFLQSLRLDLYAGETFVFTPQGDVVDLPKGATPIDFAYHIHTEVGHACVGARVNGKLVPFEYQLSSGETVEILTSGPAARSGPSRDWLGVVTTPRARTKIKQWFSTLRKEEAVAEGKEAIVGALRRARLPQELANDGTLEKVALALKFKEMDVLYRAVGEGRTSVQSIVGRVQKLHEPDDEEILISEPTITTKPRTAQGVLVKGEEDVLVRLAQCCMPVPGDRIIGFVTRGRGVSVHRADCTNASALSEDAERLVDVSWRADARGVYPVHVRVEAIDRPKLLRDVTTSVSDFGVNITSATTVTGDGIAKLDYIFEVIDPPQLTKILSTVKKVDGVFDAFRMTPKR